MPGLHSPHSRPTLIFGILIVACFAAGIDGTTLAAESDGRLDDRDREGLVDVMQDTLHQSRGCYHSLMLVQEYGDWHKLLFGTDYPFTTANATIETLGQLNAMFATSAAGRLDAQSLEEMVHRDMRGVLGLGVRSSRP